MTQLDRESLSEQQLWAWSSQKYHSTNPIQRYLVDNIFRKLAEILETLGPQDRVLEAGCGMGESSMRIREMLGERHFEVSDADERYVQRLQRTGFPIPVTLESVYEMRRADGEFDCVMLLQVLEHLEDYRTALRELFRVSSKYVVVSVPNEPLWRVLNMARGKYLSSFGNVATHINHWTPWAFKKLVSEFGTVEGLYTPIPWTIVLARVRS